MVSIDWSALIEGPIIQLPYWAFSHPDSGVVVTLSVRRPFRTTPATVGKFEIECQRNGVASLGALSGF